MTYIDARSPEAPTPLVIDHCEQCGEELRADYTFFEDKDGIRFCDTDCALEYHGVIEKEWDV